MKKLWQAIHNLTVEMIGIGLVVWMLFGFTTWGLQAAGTGRPPAWNEQFADTVVALRTQAAQTLPAPPHVEERAPFVAERLDHYSSVLGHASRNLVRNTLTPTSG